jgi:hypothetical protein
LHRPIEAAQFAALIAPYAAAQVAAVTSAAGSKAAEGIGVAIDVVKARIEEE